MIVGKLNIRKVYKDHEEIVHESENAISDGLSYGLTNLFANTGSTNLEDYLINYFQLGTSSLPGITTQSQLLSFYTLATSLSSIPEYGTDCNTAIDNHNQIISQQNLSTSVVYSTTSAIFAFLPPQNKTIWLDQGIMTRIVIDEDMANGKTISEIGIFMKNPDGFAGKDKSVLVAYKSFGAITKTSQFSLVIDWIIYVKEGSQLGTGAAVTFTVTLPSGTGSNNTGTEYGERFEIQIPGVYYASGNPLVVAFHSFGKDETEWRIDPNLSFYSKVNAKNWFLMSVLGAIPYDNTNPADKSLIADIGGTVHLNHVRNALSYVINRYPINTNKIYFIGYESGGNAAANYASRLVDPSGYMPAALVLHTGMNAGRRAYDNFLNHATSSVIASAYTFFAAGSGVASSIPSSLSYDNLHGANWSNISALTYVNNPLEFDEISVIDYENITSTVNTSSSLIRNILHLPIYHHYNVSSGYLFSANDILRSYITPSALNYKVSSTLSGITEVLSSLDIDDALNFVGSTVLTMPTSGTIIVPRDGRYFNFSAVRSGNNIARFTYYYNTITNYISCSDVVGLTYAAIGGPNFLVSSAGLNLSDPITVYFNSTRFALLEYPKSPSQVTKNGVVALPASWNYNSTIKRLLLIGALSQFNTWVITP